jgi:hypothetical protein
MIRIICFLWRRLGPDLPRVSRGSALSQHGHKAATGRLSKHGGPGVITPPLPPRSPAVPSESSALLKLAG